MFKHIEGIVAKEVFSGCRNFRYKLEIENTFSKGARTVCVIMQNPSIANADIADKSVQFLEKLIFQKDYAEFVGIRNIIIVNQFAYVQTKDFNGSEEHIGAENDSYIRHACNDADVILIAWGSSNSYNGRKKAINLILSELTCKQLLQTRKHPSRGGYVDFVRAYSI